MASRVHWSEAEGKPLIEARKDEPGAMLPILHDLRSASATSTTPRSR